MSWPPAARPVTLRRISSRGPNSGAPPSRSTRILSTCRRTLGRWAITTVVTPRYDIGYKSAEMLVRQLKGEDIPKGRLDLGFELAVREST